MITENAKDLINTIIREHGLTMDRLNGGHIRQDQVMGCLIERLSTTAKRDQDMRAFLETIAIVPEDEDTDEDADWAKDPRDIRHHDVRTREIQPENVRPDGICEHPLPGERIC